MAYIAVVAQALLWLDKGLDFADAIHVSARGAVAEFVTFDEKLVKRATRAGIAGVKLA